MTRLGTPDVAPLAVNSRTQIDMTGNTHQASDALRNVTQGAADLIAIEIDNLETSAEKGWLKLYDDASSAWTPGTTKPILILPVSVYANSATTTHATGFMSGYCLEGYPFEEGISAAFTLEDGDEATASSTATPVVNLIHRKPGSIVAVSSLAPLLTGLRTMQIGGAVENLRLLIGQSDNTPQDDVTGSFVNIIVYRIRVNCLQNPAEDVSVRLFTGDTPTVGTDDAELMVPGKRGRDLTWEFPHGIVFSTTAAPFNLSIATVKSQGATSGNLAPTGIVDVIIDINSAA